MSDSLPPTIDPIAAARWQRIAAQASPWLHEEVGRRMQERLQWIVRSPEHWCDWEPLRGGMQAHALLRERYAQAACTVVQTQPEQLRVVQRELEAPWWQPRRWTGARQQFGLTVDAGMDMLWSNMHLHELADPQAMLARWHGALRPQGFLMFSCLGPDTLRELHKLYATLGWAPAGQSFTDMHDWGDMLVQAGFAEPVMDMERITLSFASGERLLRELRELGRNLHPARNAGLRGRRWREQLLEAMAQQWPAREADGQLALTFEIVYGHAYKPEPRARLAANTTVSLEDMRSMLGTSQNRGLR